MVLVPSVDDNDQDFDVEKASYEAPVKLELSEIEVWSQCLDLDLAKMKNILNLDIAKRKKLLALYRSISENTSKYSDRKFHTLLIAMKYSFERYLFSK